MLRRASGMAGLVLLLGAGPRPAAAQALAPTWVADRTAAGSLYVPHPPGWVVQERNAGAFIVYRPGTGPVAEALVYVRPQRFGAGRNAADVLGLLPREEADLFPGARVLRGDAVPPPRTGVQGEFTFTLQGRAFRGVAVVLHTGATGALYVMSASAAAWPQQALTMAQILSAFRYLSPEGAAGASPAAAVSAMQPWRDPNEGAFTLPVPRGWQVQGGMMRPNPIEYRPEVVLVSRRWRHPVAIGRRHPGAVRRALRTARGLCAASRNPTVVVRRQLLAVPARRTLSYRHLPAAPLRWRTAAARASAA